MSNKRPTAAEAEGSKAYANGLELKNNPYAPGKLADQWVQGWKRASENRKTDLRHTEEQEALDQMMALDWALDKLAPKSLRRHSESNWVWIRLGGVAVLIGWVFGFGALIVFVAFSGFFYACVSVFVLVQHFAKKYGETPWKKVLSYTVGGIIGLVVLLIMWKLLVYILDVLRALENV